MVVKAAQVKIRIEPCFESRIIQWVRQCNYILSEITVDLWTFLHGVIIIIGSVSNLSKKIIKTGFLIRRTSEKYFSVWRFRSSAEHLKELPCSQNSQFPERLLSNNTQPFRIIMFSTDLVQYRNDLCWFYWLWSTHFVK